MWGIIFGGCIGFAMGFVVAATIALQIVKGTNIRLPF